MDPTGLVYVAVILHGITLVSPEAVPAEECENVRKYNREIIFMCIEKEECGRIAPLKRCNDDPLPRRKYARKR